MQQDELKRRSPLLAPAPLSQGVSVHATIHTVNHTRHRLRSLAPSPLSQGVSDTNHAHDRHCLASSGPTPLSRGVMDTSHTTLAQHRPLAPAPSSQVTQHGLRQRLAAPAPLLQCSESALSQSSAEPTDTTQAGGSVMSFSNQLDVLDNQGAQLRRSRRMMGVLKIYYFLHLCIAF